MRLVKHLLSLGLAILLVNVVGAQQPSETYTLRDILYPTVFSIGEHSDAFEKLSLEYERTLLSSCDDNMNEAYGKWLHMLHGMEDHAQKLDFNLKGVKLWIKVFWDKNGEIEHIAYFLKPTSRNVNEAKLTAFFKDFMTSYDLPLKSKRRYSHYGMASFPTYVPLRAPNDSNTAKVN